MKKLTEEQCTEILSYSSLPEPLREIELDIPFLYVRGIGVMYPNFGHHHILLATLFAFQHGLESAGEGIIEPSVNMDINEMQEAMLEQEGIAWLSGVGRPVIFHTGLNHAEKSYLPGAQKIEA